MNTKNILITGLVGAIITLLLTNIPIVSLVNCLIYPVSGWVHFLQPGCISA